MPPTPENTEFLIFGLVAIFVIMGLFMGSLMLRWRNLQRDIQMIEQLRDDDR
jgi:hypothetical protein